VRLSTIIILLKVREFIIECKKNKAHQMHLYRWKEPEKWREKQVTIVPNNIKIVTD
jgi:hypothetical protein